MHIKSSRQVAERKRSGARALRVFDFDDTLVKHDSRVRVMRADGSSVALTSGEYATYKLQPGETYDYSEFERSVNPRTIKWTAKILRAIYDKYGSSGVVILTARGSRQLAPVYEFLVDAGLPDIKVVGLESTNPADKRDWIARRIEQGDVDHVEFFDDSAKNIAAVKELQGRYPDVEIIVRHITH